MFNVWNLFISVWTWKWVCTWQESNADQSLFYFSICTDWRIQLLQAKLTFAALKMDRTSQSLMTPWVLLSGG